MKGLVEWGMWLNPLSGSVNNAVIYKRKKMDRTLLFPSVFIIICSVSTRNVCTIVVLLCHSTVGDVCYVRDIIRFCGC